MSNLLCKMIITNFIHVFVRTIEFLTNEVGFTAAVYWFQ